EKRLPYCSPDQIQRLLAKAPDVLWQAMLAVIYSTGLRLQEALHLTWADIDFGAGELEVVCHKSEGFVQPWTPKDHEKRRLPLPKQAIDLLTKWQAQAPVACPYTFMEAGRWQYYRERVEADTWKPEQV